LNAQRYSDGILRPVFVSQLLEAENVPVLPWPAYSCHPFRMFGMLWIKVYVSVFQILPIFSNFTQPLKRRGTTFHRPPINSLINTMRRRCVTQHEANGHTRY
jgi:hypothetical protein